MQQSIFSNVTELEAKCPRLFEILLLISECRLFQLVCVVVTACNWVYIVQRLILKTNVRHCVSLWMDKCIAYGWVQKNSNPAYAATNGLTLCSNLPWPSVSNLVQRASASQIPTQSAHGVMTMLIKNPDARLMGMISLNLINHQWQNIYMSGWRAKQ